MYSIILLAIMLILSACNGDENNENNLNNDGGSEDTNNPTEINDTNNDNSSNDNNNNSNDQSGSSGSFQVETEDQVDLVIGDTGRFDTTLGTYEITLDSIEFLGNSLDDVQADNDHLILLNITVENTSDRNISLDDIINGLELTDDLELRGEEDASYHFDSIEFFEGTLEPGDRKSGQLLMDVKNADEYYFREDPQTVRVGLTNAVMWTFTEEESD